MKSTLLMLTALVAIAVAARPKSECEKHRQTAIEHESIMKLIPKCKENGDYEALQCYEDSDFCVCYDKKGHPVSPSSKTIRECDCHTKRKQKMDLNVDNAYLPQCDAVGKWLSKQCWDYNGSCWCVDEKGERVGDMKSGDNAKSLTC